MTAITVADVKYVASRLARGKAGSREAREACLLRGPHLLESCVLAPFQRRRGKSRYPSLAAKAGLLFYLMIKSRPFLKGNKRVAVTTLLAFLLLNGKWIQVGTPELFSFAVWVAQSPNELKNQVVEGAQKFIKMHLVKSL